MASRVRALTIGALLIVLCIGRGAAQAPGARIESGRDHRAQVRAETYLSLTTFLSQWQKIWDARNENELLKVYVEDASVRLPGGRILRGRPALLEALRANPPGMLSLSHIDFETDGENAVIVSCYSLQRDGQETSGLVTSMLVRTSRAWRFRLQVFDLPRAGSDAC